MRPVYWRRVEAIERGKYPEPFVAFLSLSCCHCASPSCIDACPVDVISKREEDGIVVVDSETCQGKDSCGLCKDACPYDIPQFGPEADAKMEMCTFCLDRLAEGKNPVCVEACPMRALDAGDLMELKEKYGDEMGAEGFIYDIRNRPSVVFKPKRL
jgi:anaerobic dimethyl sulfoxide reductase subunit B (iron-sulfur subunit)